MDDYVSKPFAGLIIWWLLEPALGLAADTDQRLRAISLMRHGRYVSKPFDVKALQGLITRRLREPDLGLAADTDSRSGAMSRMRHGRLCEQAV